MQARLQFLGAAGTVTGSKYLFTYNQKKILIDCGLFQGIKSLRLKNWSDFPIAASEIDCIILTHAHIDHSGYIPRLMKQGFKGKIYCTTATKEVCQILLQDCGSIQEEEAAYLNRIGRSKHKPALPLFTEKEARKSIEHFVEVDFNSSYNLSPEISFKFSYAGHILGAASVLLSFNHEKIFFTGDVGRPKDPIFFPPARAPEAKFMVTESTYGNRLHGHSQTFQELQNIVNTTASRNGVVLIPAFAVGRAHSLMHYLTILRRQNKIPDIPFFLNSPMAVDFGKVFRNFKDLHRLSEQDCSEISKTIKIVRTVEESKNLNLRSGPMVIISASGMLTGGRVLHHMKAFAPDPKNTILLAGFQSEGTRGRALLEGQKEIKIHGDYVPVRAEVKYLQDISAHADYSELIDWFKASEISPKKVFVTHGEASAADEFRRRLEETFEWDCLVPEANQIVDLN